MKHIKIFEEYNPIKDLIELLPDVVRNNSK